MTLEPLKNSATAGDDECESQLHAERPIIKILLYTDDPRGITAGQEALDLGTMIEHLCAHAPTFARLCVKWLSRNSSDADNTLSAEMLEEYDQIWFFGIHQVSREKFTLGVLRGGPESELNEDEVRALGDWMKIDAEIGLRGGGVLMTGDHANQLVIDGRSSQNKLRTDKSGKEEFLGLGRALGRRVPRAGLLRKWEGEPTNRAHDSFNTQAFVPGFDLDHPVLQLDQNPLQLLLRRFDAKGDPAPGGYPHPLFFYRGGKWIQVFPDHLHEGAVIIPKTFNKKVWPKGKVVQPKPRVVARGIDNRNCRLLNILAAYNGDCAGVGRIVADSTWHHYLNENLASFRPPAPEGSAADQIGQFYGNLAVWLSPLSTRRKMAYVMFCWLVNHLSILEELRVKKEDGDDALDIGHVLGIGRAAYSILSQVASPCEIHELLQAVVPDNYRDQFETLYFPERGVSLSLFPSKEVILGFIVDSYQQEMIKIEASGSQDKHLDVVGVTSSGFEKAFKGHAKKISQAALEVKNVFKVKST